MTCFLVPPHPRSQLVPHLPVNFPKAFAAVFAPAVVTYAAFLFLLPRVLRHD